ncbi:nucleotide sugar dehydrogenase [Candidatus Parcubacteria bacterium]|jgi:UDPglucose 6-dehydrogenase|nr:nucleotide sugar dehydrogenase [Candidatus Parcubacteria bacterium]MBT3948959.1 nucleotide sugar dehydrogenase [Candidatus Parcubacteria bacterium]
MKNISIIGLGKLGSCMAAAYASKGHNVVGVDINQDFVDAINNGKAPVDEKDLAEYINKSEGRLRATIDYSDAIKNSDITFIIVPTPTDETGGFTSRYVQKSCESIGVALKEKERYHLVVLTSTLLPGVCEEEVISVLEKFSGKKCGQDFGFCYSPEFIAIGTVVHDLLNPDFLLVGECDERAGDILEDFYNSVTDNSAPSRRMSIKSAELTKISVNSFLTMKITYANMLAEIAENIPGVDVDDVTNAIGSDKRIGKYYLRGGLGFGGPCFPRDNRAFSYMAKKRGVNAPYADRTDEYNKTIINRAIKYIKDNVENGGSVGIIGLSYKPGTYFCEESQAISIAQQLSEDGYKVNVFESHGHSHAKEFLGDRVYYCEDLNECVEKSSLLFLSNMDKELEALPKLLGAFDNKVVVDPWRQFDQDTFGNNSTYISFGIK